MTFPPPSSCDPYWEHADWLPPWYILDHWCQQDSRCRHAKQQALLSACERGEIDYRRSDGKTFDDPIHELSSRGILLIDRDNFVAWATTVDGKSPLPARPRKQPPYPGWASPGACRFDENLWEWVVVRSSAESHPSPIPADIPPPARQPLPVATSKPAAHNNNGSVAVEGERIDAIDEATPKRGGTKSDYATYPPQARLRELGVPADEIIAAFQVEPTRHRNMKWWKERMRNVSRANKGLAEAIVQKGLPSRGAEHYPSWWRPDRVARWLIETGHLPVFRTAPILRQEFPAWAKSFDEQ